MKFVNPFRKAFSREQIRIFNFFARVQLFHSLSYEEMAEFLPYLHVRSYQKNEAVFFRNDPNQALYIIKSGTIELSLDVKDDFETLAFAEKYVSIGNNALLEGRKRHYNAIAYTESCELYVIPQVNLLEIFDRHLSIKAKMLTALAEINDSNTAHLFKAYQNNFGFFDLGQAYMVSFQPLIREEEGL